MSEPEGKTAREGRAPDAVAHLVALAQPHEPVEELSMLAGIERELFGGGQQPFRLSRYVVMDRIGGGGAGVVYRGYDPELDRAVAIKLIRSYGSHEISERRAHQRLLAEAQAMARIRHPNVVSVYDVGDYDLGTLVPSAGAPLRGVFVVMELLGGEDLGRWLSRRTRSWRDVLEVFVAAGRGLAAAHERGVLHRDFKPTNVLVESDGRVCVVDFGLARAIDETAAGSALPDPDPPVPMGTPLYMAPEQHRGEEGDERTDQFGFCVALYEALYAQAPFRGDTSAQLGRAKDAGEIAPAPIGSRVPSWLHRALVRGLARDPLARHPSMAELVEMLERRAHALRRRWPALAGVALVAIAAAIASVVADDPPRCERQAELLRGVWDDGVKEKIARTFRDSDRSYARDTWTTVATALDGYADRWADRRKQACEAMLAGETSPAAAAAMSCLERRLARLAALTEALVHADDTLIDRAAESVQSLPSIDACARSPVEVAGDGTRGRALALEHDLARAEVLGLAAEYDQALELARAAGSEARTLGLGATRARAVLLLGRMQSDSGRYPEAERTLAEAVEIAESIGDVDLAIEAMVEFGTFVSWRLDREREAEPLVRMAVARLQFRGLEDDLDVRALALLGHVLRVLGHFAEAGRRLDQALAMSVRIHGEDHLRTADVLNAIGSLTMSQRRFDEAEHHFARTLQIREAALGMGHPDVARALNNLANIMLERARPEEGLVGYRLALDIFESTLGPGNGRSPAIMINLASALRDLDRHEEALEYYLRAYEVLVRNLGPEGHTVATLYLNVAESMRHQERFVEALDLAERALAIYRKLLPEPHHDIAQALDAVGFALTGRGLPAQAIEHHRRALAMFEATQGVGHFTTAASLSGIGSALDALGRHGEALETLSRSYALAATELPSEHHLMAEIATALDRARAAASR